MNIFKGEPQYAIVLDAEGDETGHIVPWPGLEAIRLAYQCDGYALQVNGDDEPLCDFRRWPRRVWTSRFGQEVRVFQTNPGVWQFSVAGMDISDGAVSTTEDAAISDAKADAGTPGPWSEAAGDYPRWAVLFAGPLAEALAGASPQDITRALRALDNDTYDAVRDAVRAIDDADYEGVPETCVCGGKIRFGTCRDCGDTYPLGRLDG